MWIVALGALAGLLVGWMVRDKGFRLVVNVVVGILGAAVGASVLGELGTSIVGAEYGAVVAALAGAAALLFLVSLIK